VLGFTPTLGQVRVATGKVLLFTTIAIMWPSVEACPFILGLPKLAKMD